jgi:hypothetical protein
MAAPPHRLRSGGDGSGGSGAECRSSWPALGGAHGAQLPHAPTDVASAARRGVADRLRRPLCGAGRAALRRAFGLATAALLLLPASCGKSLTSLDIMKLADIDAQARRGAAASRARGRAAVLARRRVGRSVALLGFRLRLARPLTRCRRAPRRAARMPAAAGVALPALRRASAPAVRTCATRAPGPAV